MRCRICKGRAQVHLRHHNLALCRDHFVERFEREVLRTIRSYTMFTPQDRVLVAVSGGKDSLAVLYLLHKHGYNVQGFYIDLAIDGGFGYSTLSRQKVETFSQRFGIPIEVYPLKKYHLRAIPDLVQHRHQVPCSMCGTVKRYLMNWKAVTDGYDVVVTGHNLDDEVATLFGNTLRWDIRYLSRQGPFLPSTHPHMAAKAKPFAFMSEKEVALYAIFSGIDYVRHECPFAQGAKSILYKELLNTLEERSPGTKLRFYREFLTFQKAHLDHTPPGTGVVSPSLRSCLVCGMPTTSEVCAFCRMMGSAPVVETKGSPS